MLIKHLLIHRIVNHEHNDAIKLESMYFWTDGALVAETMLKQCC